MTERELQDAVLELAALMGWKIHHDRPARRKDGSWTTAIEGDPGFPDLILVRTSRMVAAELKSENGKPTGHQRNWLDHFIAVPCVEVHLWRPEHWTNGDIYEVLKR